MILDRTNNALPRKNSAASLVTLTFNRTDITPGATEYEVGRKVRTENGIEFTLLTAMTMSASATFGAATAQAAAAGRAGNVTENTIVSFVGPKPQGDMTVTNSTVAAGGSERETDKEYVARARDFFRSVRRGTLGAIEFGSLQVTGVSRVNVIEETDESGDPNGRVTAYIADSEGRSNDLLLNKVRVALLEFRCLGIPVNLFSGVVQLVSINYDVAFDASIDTAAAADQLRTLTEAALEAQRPGDPLRNGLLVVVARSVPGVIVSDNSVTPSGDLQPTEPNYVIRTTKGLVTVNGI